MLRCASSCGGRTFEFVRSRSTSFPFAAFLPAVLADLAFFPNSSSNSLKPRLSPYLAVHSVYVESAKCISYGHGAALCVENDGETRSTTGCCLAPYRVCSRSNLSSLASQAQDKLGNRGSSGRTGYCREVLQTRPRKTPIPCSFVSISTSLASSTT